MNDITSMYTVIQEINEQNYKNYNSSIIHIEVFTYLRGFLIKKKKNSTDIANFNHKVNKLEPKDKHRILRRS